MSGIVKGLANLERLLSKQSGDGKPREKARWVKLEDGQTVRITFLQELDEDARNFNPAAGVAFIASEHSNPSDYRKKALCTADEGKCYGCEQDALHPREGWRARNRLYVNVLVDDGSNDPYVGILSQGTSTKAITPALLMWAGDNESITDSSFRLRRTGEKTATEYALVPVPRSEGLTPEEINELELYDLERIVTRTVPYDEQEAFYNGEQQDSAPEKTVEKSAMEW